jgi:hypothetical protein
MYLHKHNTTGMDYIIHIHRILKYVVPKSESYQVQWNGKGWGHPSVMTCFEELAGTRFQGMRELQKPRGVFQRTLNRVAYFQNVSSTHYDSRKLRKTTELFKQNFNRVESGYDRFRSSYLLRDCHTVSDIYMPDPYWKKELKHYWLTDSQYIPKTVEL